VRNQKDRVQKILFSNSLTFLLHSFWICSAGSSAKPRSYFVLFSRTSASSLRLCYIFPIVSVITIPLVRTECTSSLLVIRNYSNLTTTELFFFFCCESTRSSSLSIKFLIISQLFKKINSLAFNRHISRAWLVLSVLLVTTQLAYRQRNVETCVISCELKKTFVFPWIELSRMSQ